MEVEPPLGRPALSERRASMGRTVLEVEPPRGPPSSFVQSNRPFADKVFLEVEPPPGPQLPSRSPASEPPSPQASKSTSFSQHLFHQDLDFHDPDKTMTSSARTCSVRPVVFQDFFCQDLVCPYAPLSLRLSVCLPLCPSDPVALCLSASPSLCPPANCAEQMLGVLPEPH